MYEVIVEWLPQNQGGRKSIPSNVKYYPIARFLDDEEWPVVNAWSVVLELGDASFDAGKWNSIATIKFLVDEAPKEKLDEVNQFDIYEGPKKVGEIFILGKVI